MQIMFRIQMDCQLCWKTAVRFFRASGYIRSETIDGSAAVHLSPQQNAGYEIPFGYNSTLYTFKYQCTNGCGLGFISNIQEFA